MKITKLEGYCLSSPYGTDQVFGQPLGVKSIGIVEVHTDVGYVGFGETYSGVYTPELIAPIIQFLQSIVIGRNPLEINEINNSLRIPFITNSGLVRSIISAIDIALWDIKGQYLKQPIASLINDSARNSIKVYASGGSVAMSSQEICFDVEKVLENGYDAYKMRVGSQTWKSDLERVTAARKSLGENNELMIDAIMGTLPNAWDLKTAINCLRDLAEFRPSWVEEPLPPEDYLGYQDLNANTELPIAMGESFSGIHEFEAYITSGCVDVIQPDVTHCGGFTQALKIIRFAEERDIPVALHVWGSALSIMANLHLACAMPTVKWLEIPQVRLEVLSDSICDFIRITNGYVPAIEKPGLGLTITDKLKEKYPFLPGSGYRVPSRRA